MAGKKVKEQATDQAPEQEQEVIRELTEEKAAVLRNDPEFMDPFNDNARYAKQTWAQKVNQLAKEMLYKRVTHLHFNLFITNEELTDLWTQCKTAAAAVLHLVEETPEKEKE